MLARPLYILATMLAVGAAGCGWLDGDDDFLTDDPPVGTVEESPPPPQAATLDLNVQVGQRVPLMKTIEQSLTQKSGLLVISGTSRLELLLALEVEDLQQGRTRFGVRYQRVRYSHDIAGDKVSYDSGAPPSEVPPAAQPYHGLVGNGFSFWVGPDYKIDELVGFQEFLERCVAGVPVEQRQELIARLVETSGEEGIANFVDDSIGLLPTASQREGGRTVSVGDAWVAKRQVVRPLPMYLSDTCTLKQVDETMAEVEIVGTIAPAAVYGPSDQENAGMQLTVRGGHSFGSCRIDRRTGLPVQSQIERFIEMNVTLADGSAFDQHKKIVTTISTFPQQVASAGSGQ